MKKPHHVNGAGLGGSTNRVEIDAVSLFHPSGSYSPLQLALSNRHS